MALTPSTMLPLGTRAPHFKLQDTDGKLVSLEDFPEAPGYLIVFLCNHCPFVKHIREKLAALTSQWIEEGFAVIGINANDTEHYPEDNLDKMKEEKARFHYRFPYLLDESQSTAKAFQAACTPEFYLFDSTLHLYYRGQFDDSRPGNPVPVTGKDLLGAIQSLKAQEKSPASQKPSVGCNIKWKPGNEPDYFSK